MTRIVLDASALLALLKREHGSEVVEQAVPDAVIAAVNLGEAAQKLFRLGWRREQFEATISALGLPIISVDAPLALDTAVIREIGRAKGLSQADCVCLALAKRLGVAAMTADQRWREVEASVGVELRYIR